MGLFLLYFLVVITIGPIFCFYRKIKIDFSNKFSLILSPAITLLYIYMLIDHRYETQTGFYLLIICIALSAYSTILTAIMYNQYRNEHKNTPDE